MALISDIVKEASLSSKMDEATVTNIARNLRENGLLSQKGRGRGAAKATSLDAARLYIALMANLKVGTSAEVVNDIGRSVCTYQYVNKKLMESEEFKKIYSGINLHDLLCLREGHKFEDAIAAIISLYGETTNPVIQLNQSKLAGFTLEVPLEISLSFPDATGKIEFGSHVSLYEHQDMTTYVGYLEDEAKYAISNVGSVEVVENRVIAEKNWEKIAEKYNGFRRTCSIDEEQVRPLAEVVADKRLPQNDQR